MTNVQIRNIKEQIAASMAVINHDAIGHGILAQKLKHRQTRLQRLVHFNR